MRIPIPSTEDFFARCCRGFSPKRCPVLRSSRREHSWEVLEARIAPAFTSTVASTTAQFQGDGASDPLTITESGGFLMHDHAADPGFFSALDFDSTQPGDQKLPALATSIVNVDGGTGGHSFTETRSTSFDAGLLTLGGAVSLKSTGANATITVSSLLRVGSLTIKSDHLDLSQGVNAGTGSVTLAPFTPGTLIDLGGADRPGTLGLTAGEINLVTAGVIHIGGSTSGDINVSANIDPSNTNQLELETGGQINDFHSSAGPDLTVQRLALIAGAGIGGSGSPNGALETQVANLEARTNDGGIRLSNSAALILGGVTTALTGVTVVNTGDIDIRADGTLSLADTDGSEVVRGGSFSGDIFLAAVGATADVQSTVDQDAITAPAGKITVNAERDILFGTAGVAYDNDVRAGGGVTLIAGRDVTVDGFSDVASNDFGQYTAGAVSVTAGHDINISNSYGDDASLGVSGSDGGSVTLTAGTGGTVHLTAPSSSAVYSNGGDVTVNADALDIAGNSGISASAGTVTLNPVTLTSVIDLGGADAPGTLGISDTELGAISAAVLRIGDFLDTGGIQISSTITRHMGYSTLVLNNAHTVSQTAPLSVANLEVALYSGNVMLTNAGNDVDTLAGSAYGGGNFSYTDANDLTIGSVGSSNGVIANNDLTISTGGKLTVDQLIEAVNTRVSLTAGGQVTEGTDGHIVAPGLVLHGAGPYDLTNSANDVGTLAANVTNAVSYTDANALTIGFVAGIKGIVTANHAITVATVDGKLDVTDTNPGADVNAGTGFVSLTVGGAAGLDRALTIGFGADVSGLSGVTFTADHISLSAPVDAGKSTATLQPFEDGTLINVGGSNGAGTLGVSDFGIDLITAGAVHIGRSSAGTLTITQTISPTDTRQLELETGADIVDGHAGTDIFVTRLALIAGTGIGLGPGDLAVQVSNLEAQTDTGGMNLATMGKVNIGGVTPSLTGLLVITSGDIHLNDGGTGSGSVFLSDTDGLEVVRGGIVSGDIFLSAIGDTADLQSSVNHDAITAPNGNITVNAGRDILFGTAGSNYDNDVRANGDVTLTAGRDVIIDGFADVASDAFGRDTGGSVSVSAGVDIDVVNNFGDSASIGASGNGGGGVTLTAGAAGAVKVLAPDPYAVFSTSGDVTVNANALTIFAGTSGITSQTGVVTLQPVTLTRAIDLGDALPSGVLGITDAELGRIFAHTLRIGNSSDTGGITISSPITRHAGYDILALSNDSSISQTAPLAVAHLFVGSNTSVTLTNTGNDVDTLAGAAGAAGNFSYTDANDLGIDTVDGHATTHAGNDLTIITGGTLAINHPVSSTNTFVSLSAGGVATQGGGGTIIAPALELLGAGPYDLTNPGNDVGTLAANITNAVSYTDANALDVGTAHGTNGITTVNGNITLTTTDGDLHVLDTKSGADIDAVNADIKLTAGTVGTTARSITLDANASLRGLNGIVLTADHASIAASVDAGSAQGTVKPFTAGTLIHLGAADGVNTLGLTDSELDFFTAHTLQIGDSASGAITISAEISPAHYQTLSLQKDTTFTATGGFAADISSAGNYENIQVNGAVMIDPSATLTVTAQGGFVPSRLDTFTIIENLSALPTTGHFAGQPEGTLVSVGGVMKKLTYVSGGNDVALIGYEGIFTVSNSRQGGAVGVGSQPYVRIFDVTTGLEESRLLAYEKSYRDGVRVAMGDFNGDGFDDIVTATRTGSGRIRIFDGLTHELITLGGSSQIKAFAGRQAHGAYIAVSDVNRDGQLDIIAGSGLGGGLVKVFDGSTGALLETQTPFGTRYTGGIRVAGGDVNGDGVGDIVTGQGRLGSKVTVYLSSSIGAFTSALPAPTVSTFQAGAAHLRDGVFLATGDTNGDGVAEVIVGRGRAGNKAGASVGIFEFGAGGPRGIATPAFTEIDTIALNNRTYYYGARVAATDVNSDGIADIIVGAGPFGGSRVQILDGTTHAELTHLIAFPGSRDLGVWTAAAPAPPQVG